VTGLQNCWGRLSADQRGFGVGVGIQRDDARVESTELPYLKSHFFGQEGKSLNSMAGAVLSKVARNCSTSVASLGGRLVLEANVAIVKALKKLAEHSVVFAKVLFRG